MCSDETTHSSGRGFQAAIPSQPAWLKFDLINLSKKLQTFGVHLMHSFKIRLDCMGLSPIRIKPLNSRITFWLGTSTWHPSLVWDRDTNPCTKRSDFSSTTLGNEDTSASTLCFLNMLRRRSTQLKVANSFVLRSFQAVTFARSVELLNHKRYNCVEHDWDGRWLAISKVHIHF